MQNKEQTLPQQIEAVTLLPFSSSYYSYISLFFNPMKKVLIFCVMLNVAFAGTTVLYHSEYRRTQRMWFEQMQQNDSLKRELGQNMVTSYNLLKRMETYHSIMYITLSNHKIPLTAFKSVCDIHSDYGPSIWVNFVDYKNKADRQTQDFISRIRSGQIDLKDLPVRRYESDD